jgi:hypothetical protein
LDETEGESDAKDWKTIRSNTKTISASHMPMIPLADSAMQGEPADMLLKSGCAARSGLE